MHLGRRSSPNPLAFWCFVGTLVGCAPNKGADSGAPSLGDVLPDWGLTDVNENSPTGGERVQVSDQRGRVSAWYFGHST
jgi:hypothetical protein